MYSKQRTDAGYLCRHLELAEHGTQLLAQHLAEAVHPLEYVGGQIVHDNLTRHHRHGVGVESTGMSNFSAAVGVEKRHDVAPTTPCSDGCAAADDLAERRDVGYDA